MGKTYIDVFFPENSRQNLIELKNPSQLTVAFFFADGMNAHITQDGKPPGAHSNDMNDLHALR
jgi:hypothetical protein